MILEMYGVWIKSEKEWHTFSTIEDAVYAYPDEIIYRLAANPVGKFKLETKLVELHD